MPTTQYYVRAYASNSVGTTYRNELNFITEEFFECGNVLTKTHIAGDVAPVNKTVNYITLQSDLSGSPKCWILQNLGADHPADSFADTSEASAGWYWQFNRKQGYKHDGITRTPNNIWIRSICERSDGMPANDPCTHLLGSGWRMPTKIEVKTVFSYKGWPDISVNQFYELKFHVAGVLHHDTGALILQGTNASHWSSESLDTKWACRTYLEYGDRGMTEGFKTVVRSIHCLKD